MTTDMETPLAHLDSSAVERLLVVCLDNLGDLVFVSALVPPLRARFPKARVTLWCKAYTAGIAGLIPGVDAIVASDPFWDRAPGRGKGRFVPFARTVLALRRERFDLAVIASPQWRACAAVRATGAHIRLSKLRRKNRVFLTHAIAAADSSLPVLEDHARLLDALGAPHAKLAYALDGARLAEERSRIAAQIGQAGLGSKGSSGGFVALHPFASKRERCVALGEWLAVADALAARGSSVTWIGSARELDEVRAARTAVASERFADQLTSGDLREMAALLSLADLFVGHDSGPMHVANALGVPVVGIFAPGQPQRTFPQGVAPSRVLYAPTPREIDAAAMLREINALAAASSPP
jgi:ADP-heptose:LPS heptosyltransferase